MTRPRPDELPSSPEAPRFAHLRDRSQSHSYSDDSSGIVRERMHAKKDEPASPLQVVFYVVCFYLVWQIFTRNDELEVLDHGSVGGYRASLRSSQLGDHLGVNGYSLPYPQISTPSPPPISSVGTGAAGSTSFTSLAITTLIFPFAQLFNLIFFVLHYLSIILLVIAWSLHYLALPITSILSVLVLVPVEVLSRTASALYPLYVLLGGLVGIGVGMGVVAAWLGRELPRWFTRAPAKKHRRRHTVPVPAEEPRTRRRYISEDEVESVSTHRASTYSHHSSSLAPPAIALRKRAQGGRLR